MLDDNNQLIGSTILEDSNQLIIDNVQIEGLKSQNTQFDDSEQHFSAAWGEVVNFLKNEIDSQIFSAYIEPLKYIGFDSDSSVVTLGAPSKFVSSKVQDNFESRIVASFKDALIRKGYESPITGGMKLQFNFIDCLTSKDYPLVEGKVDGIDSAGNIALQNRVLNPQRYIVVKKFSDPFTDKVEDGRAGGSTKQNVVGKDEDSNNSSFLDSSSLNNKYTFESFVVGSSNQFCHAASMRVAEQPGKSYNPLFIYGGVGLGKTHLLHSIGNSVLARNPSTKVLYMSSEAFTNELIQALRHAKMEEFKRKIRNIELLLIDDIQFISGKERTQEEFFHTFNALYAAKNQIVITSDRLPSDIPGIEERLQTRFSWGLTADLQAPDFETRVAILNKKAFCDNFNLPKDVAHYIAENISSNVRELEGAFTRLHALVSLQNIPLTIESAQVALKAILQPRKVNITVDDIKKAVANKFNLKVSEMISKRRTKNLSFPRHIAMFLCRKHTTASYPEIGDNFGGRDHSSVIHAASVVTSKIAVDTSVKKIIGEIEESLSIGR